MTGGLTGVASGFETGVPSAGAAGQEPRALRWEVQPAVQSRVRAKPACPAGWNYQTPVERE